jgi:hypothetical protein
MSMAGINYRYIHVFITSITTEDYHADRFNDRALVKKADIRRRRFESKTWPSLQRV